MPVAESCVLGEGVKILYPDLVNMYGCTLGDGVFVGPFVEIQNDVTVGAGTRVQSHTFICEGVSIGDRVFVGHNVTFINDRHPVANNPDWKLERTWVEDDVSIGSGAVILGGLRLGEGCQIGAGAVVTHDVEPGALVMGVPARLAR